MSSSNELSLNPQPNPPRYHDVVVGENGKTIWINTYIARQLGFEVNDLVGFPVGQMLAPGLQEIHRTIWKEIHKAETYTFHLIFQSRTGTLIPSSLTAQTGEFLGKKVACWDLNEAGQLKGKKLEDPWVSFPRDPIIFRCDHNGLVTYANPAFHVAFGSDNEEQIDTTFYTPFSKNDRANFKKALRTISQQHPLVALETQLATANDIHYQVKWEISGIFDTDDRVGEFQIIGQVLHEGTSPILPPRINGDLFYKNLVEQSRHAHYVLDTYLQKMVYLSPATADMLDHSVEEFMNSPNLWFERIAHENPEHLVRDLLTHVSKGEPFQFEYQYKKDNGEEIWIWEEGEVMQGCAEEGRYYLGSIHDITHLHFCENLLNSVFMKLSGITLDNCDQIISSTLEETGKFVQADRSFLIRLDRSQTTLNLTHEWYKDPSAQRDKDFADMPVAFFPWLLNRAGRPQDYLIQSDEILPAEVAKECRLLFSTPSSPSAIIPLITNEKLLGFMGFENLHTEFSKQAETHSLFRLLQGALSSTLDRLQIEIEYLHNEGRYQSLVSIIPDTIFRVHVSGEIVDYKPADKGDIFNQDRSIIGQNITQILSPAYGKALMDRIQSTLQHSKSETMEFQNSELNDASVFEIRFLAYSKDIVVCISRDITDRVQLEQLKSDFINRATHDLRTPIATILLMINLIDKNKDRTKYEKYWEILKNEVQRQRALIEDLLTVGRLERNALQINSSYCNLVAPLMESYKRINLLAMEKRIEMVLEGFPESGNVQIIGDSNALERVFDNLLSNSYKFSSSGGKIFIRHTEETGREIIEIEDTGIGIPAKDLPNLFERFYRGQNAIENEIPGSGVGLFIVKSLIEKMDGVIEVTSEVNKGTRFRMSFAKPHR